MPDPGASPSLLSDHSLSDHLGRVGIWTFGFDHHGREAIQTVARMAEGAGYGALWFPESAFGRDPFATAAFALEATDRLGVASGIARADNRAPRATRSAQLALTERYGERFVLGLGGAPRLEGKPVPAMRAYLTALQAAPYSAPKPRREPGVVIAALGPLMLKLARERASGAHTYLVTPEHTRFARKILGSEPLLAVEQAVVLSQPANRAREWGRRYAREYFAGGVGGYADMLRRLGFRDADLTSGGSDRLIDALVAAGSCADIVARVGQHFDAGADHVCLQVLGADQSYLAFAEWEELATALADPPTRA